MKVPALRLECASLPGHPGEELWDWTEERGPEELIRPSPEGWKFFPREGWGRVDRRYPWSVLIVQMVSQRLEEEVIYPCVNSEVEGTKKEGLASSVWGGILISA